MNGDRFDTLEFGGADASDNVICWLPAEPWVIEVDDEDYPVYADDGEPEPFVVCRWIGGPEPQEAFSWYATREEAQATVNYLNTTCPPRPAIIHHSLAY
jgi:hypothetical protein